MKAINEVNLNLKQLDIQKNLGKRGDILVQKIRDAEPLMVNKNGIRKEIVVVNKEQVLSAITSQDGTFNSYKALKYFTREDIEKRYKEDALLGDDGQYYKLNDVEKTTYFGSSGGASLGSIDTRYVESIVCIFLAWRQLKRADLDERDIQEILDMSPDLFENFKNRYTSIDVKLNLTQQDITKYLASWTPTFIHIPNYLYYSGIIHSGFKNEFLLSENKLYRFCQLSGQGEIIKSLRSTFQKRHPGLNFAKWNPSDIFAVELIAEPDIKTKLDKCNSVLALNEIVDKLFELRQFVGISLKKVKSKEDIRIIVNKITKPPRYFFEKIRVSRLPFATLGLEIIAHRLSREFGSGSEVMVIRSRERNKLVNISGEVRGKTARHGNMSLTQINKILLSWNLDTVPTVTESTEQYYEKGIQDWSDDELKEEILEINDKIINKYGSVIEKSKLAIEVDRVRLISKYQALYLAWILMEAQEMPTDKEHKSVADSVIEEMFHFALSINITPGKQSGRTPRYARIID